MKMYRKISIAGMVVSVMAVFLLTAPKSAEACSGASCEGLDPETTGCAASTTWQKSINFYRCKGGTLCDLDKTKPYAGTILLSYSSACDATWAQLYPGLPLDARGSDSLSISHNGRIGDHEISGTIDETSTGELDSVMVAGFGAKVCVNFAYAVVDPRGYVDFFNETGCFRPSSETDSVHPNFHVVSLAYAAPGKQSVVKYGIGNTTGTEVSATDTFKTDLSVTTSVPLFLSGTFSVSGSVSSSDSLQVTKNKNLEYPISSNTDPIDHGNDTFFVWVNPQVDITFTPGLSNLKWTLNADSSGFAHVIPLTVYNAIDPTTIPAGYKPYFAKLTRQDYDAILSLDPYVDVATHTIRSTIPLAGSGRFESTGISMPLDGRVGSYFKTVDSSMVKRTDSYQLSISEGVSGGIAELFFKASANFTFTYGTSHSTSWGTSQSAEVSLKTSSTTFAGDYDVYFDRVFGTFLLVDAPAPAFIHASGVVRDSAGNPRVDERVTLWLQNGQRRVTYTDGHGQYRFYNLPEGNSTIEIRGERIRGRIDGARPITVDFGKVLTS